MCGYISIGFNNFMFKGNSLADFSNLFSPNNFKKTDDIILNYLLTKSIFKNVSVQFHWDLKSRQPTV